MIIKGFPSSFQRGQTHDAEVNSEGKCYIKQSNACGQTSPFSWQGHNIYDLFSFDVYLSYTLTVYFFD